MSSDAVIRGPVDVYYPDTKPDEQHILVEAYTDIRDMNDLVIAVIPADNYIDGVRVADFIAAAINEKLARGEG